MLALFYSPKDEVVKWAKAYERGRELFDVLSFICTKKEPPPRKGSFFPVLPALAHL